MAEDAPTVAKSAPPDHTKPPHSGGGMTALVVVVILAVAGAVGGELIYKHQKKPPGRTPPPITISTTNVATGNMDEFVPAIGTVTAIYTAMISPRVDGQLVKVNYTEGQLVTTNDLLAEIDPAPYQAMLVTAQGQLARDQAMLKGAQIDLVRFTDAYNRSIGTNFLHAVPKEQVDDQQALVDQDRGTVKVDEGAVSNAQVQLNYCFLHAPFDGMAGLRMVDPGNVVHAANTNAVVVVAKLEPITVVFSVDQQFLPAIQRQLKAGHQIRVEAFDTIQSNKLATGKFMTTDSTINTATRTIAIKALFDNQDRALFPNQFVNVNLIIDTLSNVTLIPISARQLSPQGAFVYVVTNQQVTMTNQSGTFTTNQAVVAMRSITTGVTDNDKIAVEGVEPGEVIATDNFNKLGDGVKVNVRQGGGEGRPGGEPGAAPGGKKKGGKKEKDKDKENPS